MGADMEKGGFTTKMVVYMKVSGIKIECKVEGYFITEAGRLRMMAVGRMTNSKDSGCSLMRILLHCMNHLTTKTSI